MSKWKITYNDMGTIKAIIIRTELWNLGNDIQIEVPDENDVIKIERVLEADNENVTDLTQD